MSNNKKIWMNITCKIISFKWQSSQLPSDSYFISRAYKLFPNKLVGLLVPQLIIII